MGQSSFSYHLGKLKEVGLIPEEKRGRWSFYSLGRGAVRDLLGGAFDRFAPDDAETPRGREGVHA